MQPKLETMKPQDDSNTKNPTQPKDQSKGMKRVMRL